MLTIHSFKWSSPSLPSSVGREKHCQKGREEKSKTLRHQVHWCSPLASPSTLLYSNHSMQITRIYKKFSRISNFQPEFVQLTSSLLCWSVLVKMLLTNKMQRPQIQSGKKEEQEGKKKGWKKVKIVASFVQVCKGVKQISAQKLSWVFGLGGIVGFLANMSPTRPASHSAEYRSVSAREEGATTPNQRSSSSLAHPSHSPPEWCCSFAPSAPLIHSLVGRPGSSATPSSFSFLCIICLYLVANQWWSLFATGPLPLIILLCLIRWPVSTLKSLLHLVRPFTCSICPLIQL